MAETVAYYIVDDGYFPSDREYVELGERKGWLELERIKDVGDGKREYYYRYL